MGVRKGVTLLLDTHILIWWHREPSRLSKAQANALAEIEKNRDPAGLSAISLRELAKAAQQQRIRVDMPLQDWLAEVASHPLLTVLPITAAIAAESVRLGPEFHRDPADQIIVATARCHDLTLVTADERIRNWGQVRIL